MVLRNRSPVSSSITVTGAASRNGTWNEADYGDIIGETDTVFNCDVGHFCSWRLSHTLLRTRTNMKTKLVPPVLLLAIIGAGWGEAIAQQASFTPLGSLSVGGDSFAFDVSANGKVVVGSSHGKPFRWTAKGGMVDLGFFPGGISRGSAFPVSASGKVIMSRAELVRSYGWTSRMVGLGLSDLGNVIVGKSLIASNTTEAFRWTPNGVVGLGDLPGGDFFSVAQAVSPDGNVIVGHSSSDNGKEAFRWTSAAGMIGLGEFPGGDLDSFAFDVSANGNVIVGQSNVDAFNIEAFCWTPSEGMVGLGDLPGGVDLVSRAESVSADGDVIVGFARGRLKDSVAFVWSQATGMLSVQELLSASDVDLTGWQLNFATAVSANGKTIVGWGRNPDGNNEAWLATVPIPVPPEPGG